MDPLHIAHLIVLGMWLGVVITEAPFEFAASDADSLRAAARFHYNVDKFGELPILFAVLVTGTILTVRAWPLTPLHFIKIAASLVAVGANLICTRWVFQRRLVEDVKSAAPGIINASQNRRFAARSDKLFKKLPKKFLSNPPRAQKN